MRRLFSLGACALLLSACATAPTPEPAATTDQLLDDLGTALEGTYVSVRLLDDPAPSIRLEIAAERLGPALAIELSQVRPGGAPRVFLLTLEGADSEGRLSGAFVPLGPDGKALSRPCDMQFQLVEAGLSGETDPQQCRFGAGESEIGLLKEIAFDGVHFVIADQIHDRDNEALGEPEILEFRRAPRFQGNAAVRDGGNDWRVGRNIAATPGQDLVEPLDASGMSLGILLNLEFIRRRPGTPALLRLQVSDLDQDHVLGEAWTEASAASIGLGLAATRVDLRRPEAP